MMTFLPLIHNHHFAVLSRGLQRKLDLTHIAILPTMTQGQDKNENNQTRIHFDYFLSQNGATFKAG